MSSSRRSSRSVRSLRPPAWSISKNSVPASVSLVFAEPEQGAPLAAASSNLSRRASIPSVARPTTETQPVVDLATQPIIEAEPQPIESVTEPQTESSDSPLPDTSSVPFPPSDSSVSWFGSLGRAKGKQVMAAAEPQPIPRSVEPHRQSTSPTSPSPLSSSFPSSIDDEEPKVSSSTAQQVQQQPVIITPNADETVRVRLNSLNPSNSRFTISLPLLGRPKVPLEQAVRTETDTNEDLTPRPIEERLNVDAPSTSPETIRAHQSSASSSSWWDYVGWRSPPPPTTPPLPAEESPTAAANPEPEASVEEPPLTAEVTPAAVESPSAAPSAVEEGKPPEEQLQRAESVFSSETARSSSWYTPWTWYGSTLSLGPPDATANGNVSTKTESEMVKEEALARDSVDSEALKPAAAPEPEPPTDDTTLSTSAKISSPEPVNPIESTFTTYRSGWASFFSSRKLVTKTITNDEVKRDENGVEIMDLDVEEVAPKDKLATESTGKAPDPPSPTPATVPKSITNVKDKEKKQAGSTSSSAVSLLLPVLMGGSSKDDSSSQRKDSRPSSPKPESVKSDKGGEKDRPAPPLTISDSVKQSVKKSAQPPSSPSSKATKFGGGKKGSGTNTPGRTKSPVPNLVLPTWEDTFHTPPRNLIPASSSGSSKLARTIRFVSGVVLGETASANAPVSTPLKDKDKEKQKEYEIYGRALPRSWDVIHPTSSPSSASFKKDKGKEKIRQMDVLRGCKRVVVIGIHGWFPGAVMRTVLGEPTGTSGKFVNMMVQALDEFQKQHNVKLEKITSIPLEGEGTINKRVERLYANLLGNQEWMDDLHAADVVFVATHSQGSVVSTHLLDLLLRDGHLRSRREPFAPGTSLASPTLPPQRICCLALCGIHLGPLRYLSSSSLVQPYIQYFESTAAKELFDFQNTESQVSKAYVKALNNIVDQGTKMVYVASLNDQVVPIYSGLFTAASHPLILRALYIDGDAYHSSDFLSNLLVLLLRVRNSGLSDSGLLAHLSEATAGSLNGVGHSTAYEELATYMLAVKYLFLTNESLDGVLHPDLKVEPFNANTEQNDYEIPWALRDLVADEQVAHLFAPEIIQLRDSFREWHPKTTILRDIKKKLQPIQRLPSAAASASASTTSTMASASKL